MYVPENSFVAPDGVTFIPETYDLGRCASLTEAVPGKSLYVTREIDKTTVRLDVAENGTVSNMKEMQTRGEYSTAVDANRNLYIADGQIFVYDQNNTEMRRISMEERPICMTLGGKGRDILFVTTSSSLYRIRIQ
jgi:sugar lactone lactonase YvrE